MIAGLVFLFGLVTLAAPVAADPRVDGSLSLRHGERGNLSLVSPTFAAAGDWTSIPNFVGLCGNMPQPCKPGDTLNLAGLGATIESTYLNYGGVQMDGIYRTRFLWTAPSQMVGWR